MRGSGLPRDACGLKTEEQSRDIKEQSRQSVLGGDLGIRVMSLMPGGGAIHLIGVLGIGDREHSRSDSQKRMEDGQTHAAQEQFFPAERG